MGFLDVENGCRIYFEQHSGRGAPVVLVHGWGASARCWDPVTPALRANGNTVVLLDQRACGRSDKDFDDVSIDALGSDLVKLCEHLSLSRPVLNGWSMAGAVVVDAAAKLGSATGGVVLTGGASPRYTAASDWPHGGTMEDVEAVLGAAEADPANTFWGVAEAVCANRPSEHTLRWMWTMFMEQGIRGHDSLRDLGRVDQRKQIATIEVPTLLLHGTQDGFVPFSAAQAATELFAKSRLVEFADCGHAPFLENRELYLAELTAFLDEVTGR